MRLLDYPNWPARPEEDLQAQQDLVRFLRARGASEEHCAAVETEIGCARLRPEEIAGGASASAYPATFAYAEAAGRQIVEALTPPAGAAPTE